ncbi:MAG: DUF423 domain-containing protein [Oligoflexia bacterium]|nr:DUF423 domain-containing protein [Oligoflexia bacterium]
MILVHACLQFALLIILGAFAAHGLKANFTTYQMDIWQTAIQYHSYHAIGLGILFLADRQISLVKTNLIHIFFTIGICLFSGSLYLLALTNLKWLGAITPIGGLSFIVGWLFFAFAVWRALKQQTK